MPHDTAERRPLPTDGAPETTPAATISDPADIASFLALSDERDGWLRRLLAAERAAYQRGLDDRRACAGVTLAEMEDRFQSVAHWREWAATLKRIIQAEADPSARMRQVMAEIAADQKFMRDARAKLAAKPWTLSPLEWCALHRVRFEDPGDAA